MRQRIAAIIGLVAFGLASLVLLAIVGTNIGAFLVALAAIGVLAAGGWWTVTERGWRRIVGATIGLTGVALMVLAVAWAVSDSERVLLRAGAVAALILSGFVATRVALHPGIDAANAAAPHQAPSPSSPVLFANARSGGGKVVEYDIVERARQRGAEVVMVEPGVDLLTEATAAVERGADCIIAAGGDGTQALLAGVAADLDVAFIVIPAGTRNHFALDIGLDRSDPPAALEALDAPFERRIDLGTVAGRTFVNNVSLGIYATVVASNDYRDAKVDTALTIAPEVLGRDTEPFDLQFERPDGSTVDGAFVIQVSNNPYATRALVDMGSRPRLDTGRLGVVAIAATTSAEVARLATALATGLESKDPNFHAFEPASIDVRSGSGRIAAGVDGESLDFASPLEIGIRPRALRLLVPESSLARARLRRDRDIRLSDLLDVARGRPPRRR